MMNAMQLTHRPLKNPPVEKGRCIERNFLGIYRNIALYSKIGQKLADMTFIQL